MAPNKAFEDLIKIFYHYHRYINRRSRLILAGARFLPTYDRALDGLVARLALADAVTFTNRVSLRELKAYYQAADLFLCASRHEGFCVPLLEAMVFDVPVIARAAASVPYTLGQAGIQFHTPDYSSLAELLHLLTQQQPLRQQIIATQRQRLTDFAPARVEGQLRALLGTLGVDLPAEDRAAADGRLTMRVHQMTATLVYGDAVSNDVFEIDRRLKAWGLDAQIYAEHFEGRVAQACRPDTHYEPFLSATDDVLIYHYSIYAPNLELYKRSRNRKLVIYHNITPPEYFHGYDSGLEELCRAGRLALSDLRDCECALADSDFNRRELVAAGVPDARTGVLPIFLGLDHFATAPLDVGLHQRVRRAAQVNLLYVGRLAPNKGCADLVKLLYVYTTHVNPDAHLWLVGDPSLAGYTRDLERLITRLGLQDKVTLTGRVSLSGLRTYYEAADVFLYASRHEGFGVPLVESMYFGVPILAYNATAVPETLGDCGVLFGKLAYPEVAEMIHLLATDPAIRRSIIAGQRRRLDDFAPARVERQLRQVLERVGIL